MNTDNCHHLSRQTHDSANTVPDHHGAYGRPLRPRATTMSTDSTSSAGPQPSTAGTDTFEDHAPKPTRRRTYGSITFNACTNCKKARTKCDGRKPACQRCINRQSPKTCHYELHSKAAKQQMLREIERLRAENKHLAQEHSALDRKNNLLESIFQALEDDDESHDDQSLHILHLLKRGKSLRSIAEQLRRPSTTDLRNITPDSERQLNMAIERYRQQWVESHDPCFWIDVTDDSVLVEHLVTLYLTWIHPLHVLFDEEEFTSSFRKCEDVYCSSAMVNAICAMACHVLRSEWRGDDGAHTGIDHLQAKFIDAVEHLQTRVQAPKLVAVQTWAIMSLVELGRGDGLMASAHLREATELLMARSENEQADASAEVASWGVLTLTTYVKQRHEYTEARVEF
ncbi:MAG: hypothetical protein Q9211_003350 [Gyalolechia sp. 1 TL-2023]